MNSNLYRWLVRIAIIFAGYILLVKSCNLERIDLFAENFQEVSIENPIPSDFLIGRWKKCWVNGKLNAPQEQEYITLNSDGTCLIKDLATGSEKVGSWNLKDNFLECAGTTYRITEMRRKKHDFTGIERLAFVGGFPQDVWFIPIPVK